MYFNVYMLGTPSVEFPPVRDVSYILAYSCGKKKCYLHLVDIDLVMVSFYLFFFFFKGHSYSWRHCVLLTNFPVYFQLLRIILNLLD